MPEAHVAGSKGITLAARVTVDFLKVNGATFAIIRQKLYRGEPFLKRQGRQQ